MLDWAIQSLCNIFLSEWLINKNHLTYLVYVLLGFRRSKDKTVAESITNDVTSILIITGL